MKRALMARARACGAGPACGEKEREALSRPRFSSPARHLPGSLPLLTGRACGWCRWRMGVEDDESGKIEMGQDGQAKKASAPLLNPRASTPQRGRGCPLQPRHLLAVAVGGSCATGSAECGSSKGAPAERGGRSWPLPSSASQARRPKSGARALVSLSSLSSPASPLLLTRRGTSQSDDGGGDDEGTHGWWWEVVWREVGGGVGKKRRQWEGSRCSHTHTHTVFSPSIFLTRARLPQAPPALWGLI